MQKRYCFLSNYLTHHQLPFCLEMMKLTEGSFTFVETEDLPQERRNMGYATLGEQYDFVVRAHKTKAERKKAMDLAFEADVVIIGSAPDVYIRRRMRANKLTFRYSERIFKKGLYDVLRLVKYIGKTLPYRNKNLYYLLSSAYAAHDYYRCGAKPEKLFQWGYFPETKIYEDTDALMAAKNKDSILWAGRMIDWKHPDAAVEIARRLKMAGIDFQLNMIGSGPLQNTIQTMIEKYNLQEHVHLLGAVNPEQVREEMEKHQIFLFTSDYNEGWGAVLNEAMNSGCAVVASHACGSVPFMVQHGENGYAYEYGNEDQMYRLIEKLLLDQDLCKRLGRSAIDSVRCVWNAKTAAENLIAFCHNFETNEHPIYQQKDGTMIKSQPIMQGRMYGHLIDEREE